MRHNKTKAMVVTVFLLLVCSACGQKRPLSLPEPAPANQAVSPTTISTKPAEQKE